ncbi:N-acetylmuramoyl-L-alanine amidase [Flavobacterium sp.]|uniref:N-acetylmuramoyl-L-alanine amidase n=1 Tax=Flavobacterium sp. TaxID=239 RepID=UPI0037AC8CBB
MFHKNKVLFTFLFTILSFTAFSQSNVFKVILDAGHGGHDAGAHYYGHVEKNIALAITLKVGKILEQNPAIKVIYTRKTDVFVTLKDRANIANKAKASLFVCIHCNANRSPAASGTETYVMGMSRTGMNFEVSKTENSVIFLEDNYKQTYKGFDPNNVETLIGLKLMQENNLANSISFASKIQDNFINEKLDSRGVKQEPLWVLDASVMPGVLIETGFVSNPTEGNNLDSDEGQNARARAIANAILSYKAEYFGSDNSEISEIPAKDTASQTKPKLILDNSVSKKEDKNKVSEGIFYKVQLSASPKKMELSPRNFKGLKNISMESDNKIYKYIYGGTSDYDEAKKQLKEAKSKGYSSAYLIAFKNGEKISVQDALNN